MTGNFNIQDNLWDSLFPHHSSISNNLFIIADFFDLGLFLPTNQVPTRYSNNNQVSNSVIDLMFLCCRSSEIDNHSIHLEWKFISDHAPLTIVIPLVGEYINTRKQTIIKNSDKE